MNEATKKAREEFRRIMDELVRAQAKEAKRAAWEKSCGEESVGA